MLPLLQRNCPRFSYNWCTIAYRVDTRVCFFLLRRTLCTVLPVLVLYSELKSARLADKSKHCFVLLVDANVICKRNFLNQPLLVGPFLDLEQWTFPYTCTCREFYLSGSIFCCRAISLQKKRKPARLPVTDSSRSSCHELRVLDFERKVHYCCKDSLLV